MVIGNSLLVACPGKGGGMCPPPGPLYKAALRPNTQNILKKDIFYLGRELMPHIHIC